MTIACNSEVKACTTAGNQIKAIRVGAEQELRDAMKIQSLIELATRASNLAPLGGGQHLAWPASDAASSSPRSSSLTG